MQTHARNCPLLPEATTGWDGDEHEQDAIAEFVSNFRRKRLIGTTNRRKRELVEWTRHQPPFVRLVKFLKAFASDVIGERI